MAGTAGEMVLAQQLYDMWKAQGLDYVTMDTYDILLSYPNRSDPNFVFLYDDNHTEVYRTQREEKILDADQNHTDVIPPFNAYSPPGHVKVSLQHIAIYCFDCFKLRF